MSSATKDFTDLLLKAGIISLDQLGEAEKMSKDTNMSVGDCLIKLEYASAEDVSKALAKHHKLEYIDLRANRIAEHVIESVPESVARENTVIPVEIDENTVKIALSDPFDMETTEKLRFILNRKIETALAPAQAILEAINQYYGQVEGESADSMLQEFTDTAIDFTETEEDADSGGESVDESSPPVVRLVNSHDRGSGPASRLRHPRRTVRRSRAHPLPDRRGAGRTGQPP